MQRAFPLIFEKIRKFIFFISQYLERGFSKEEDNVQLLFNTRADTQAEFNVWQSRHGRKIIEGIERRSKLHDESGALALRRQKFSQVSSSIRTLHSEEQLRNVATEFGCPGSAILLYHEILTDSLGMSGFQGRDRSILPT